MTDEYTLTDELERKTLDALASILTDLESGAETPATISYAVRVLFQATSGLTTGECFDLISEVSKRVSDEVATHSTRRTFIKDASITSLEFQHGAAAVTVKISREGAAAGVMNWDVEKTTTFDHEVSPFAAARERYEALAGTLMRQGFVEIL